jgi:hypothetical protein
MWRREVRFFSSSSVRPADPRDAASRNARDTVSRQYRVNIASGYRTADSPTHLLGRPTSV